jgi:hypothetical protein
MLTVRVVGLNLNESAALQVAAASGRERVKLQLPAGPGVLRQALEVAVQTIALELEHNFNNASLLVTVDCV